MKYRKKPVLIEAFRLGIDHIPDWFMDKVTSNDIILHGTSSGFEHHDDTNADIKTLEGVMHANFGDFIIKGVNNEIYPCKPDIFYASYDNPQPKHPHYNCQRGMLCPTCDKALWTRIEIKSLFGTKKITVKEQPNFCKFCGQALLPAYTEH